MSSLEIGLVIAVGGGIILFIIRDVFWSKAQRNEDKIQDKTDSDIKEVTESVKDLSEKVSVLELSISKIGNMALSHESQINTLNGDLKEYTRGLHTLTQTINSFDSNMHKQLNEIHSILKENTRAVQESSKVNSELLNYLRSK